ncbi:UDP-N-acetylglucosamine--N-acetylmuramyl-(pentapeptide) pyrophosphoryl-undecaprenol N-acetylglucosamine transferase [bacterium HR40]|nr:UDP-N-acetylglucosamine--N-acetylmuramyl-(pentapeptide) pyrophosphoryl-undecaprenol N-acetylglucosamine transferase [bacterium HR40]
MSGPIAIATGGTGGHVFPALAVARTLRALGHAVVLTSDARGLHWLAGENAVFELPSASPSGPLRRRLFALAALVRGALRAYRLYGELQPAAAAAFGGYASFPAALAARMRGIPLVVHEQNAVLGRANRIAARFARWLLLTFADTEGVPPSLRARSMVTGNPVRPDFLGEFSPPPAHGRLRLLVIGGSQGARRLGELVPAAVADLPEGMRRQLVLWMQVRAEQCATVAAGLAHCGLAELEVRPFFDDLARRLACADLVVARAGASTLAELLATGRPSILIPYPFAADDHQTANALRLARAGAAICLSEAELTSQRLASEMAALLGHPERREAMRQKALALARPDAALHIARILVSLLPAEASP